MTERRTERWYAVYTYGGAEWQAYRGLQKLGFNAWLPYYLADARRGRWALGRVTPHFPQYLFVCPDLDHPLNQVRKVNGVQVVVGTSEGPLPLDADVVGDLMHQLSGYDDRPFGEVRPHTVAAGDSCEVIAGPFAGLIVQIERVVGRERISVWLGALGGCPTELPAAVLRHMPVPRCA